MKGSQIRVDAAVPQEDDRLNVGEYWLTRMGTDLNMAELAATFSSFGEPALVSSSVEDRVDDSYDGEERRLFRLALAQSGDAVVITSSVGVIEYVNATFEKM